MNIKEFPTEIPDTLKTVILKIFKQKVDMKFSGYAMHNLDMHTWIDYVTDSLVIGMTKEAAGEYQLPYKYETYATWWDHFKDIKFPTWLKKRVKINKKSHEITLETIYPYLKFALPPNHMGKVTVLVNSVPKFSFDPNDYSKSTI